MKLSRSIFGFLLLGVFLAVLSATAFAQQTQEQSLLEQTRKFFEQAYQEGRERAQDDASSLESQSGPSFLQCAANWQNFLSAIVGYEDFIEYWKDIVRVNICHRTDIDIVEQQLRKVRRQVRSTFLRCEPERTQRLVEAYYKLEAELFFFRKAFEEFANADVEYHLRDAEGNRNETKWTELVNKLKSKLERFLYFGDDPFVQKDLINVYFQEFDAKYRGRLDTYNNCRSETWEEIGAKIEELQENFQHFGEVASDAAQTVAEETVEGAQAIGESFSSTGNKFGSLRSGPLLSTEDGFDLNLRLARVKIIPEKSFEELLEPAAELGGIFEGLGEDIGESLRRRSQQTIPHAEVPERVENEETRFAEQTSRAELEAKFTTLYAQISDDAAQEFTRKLNDLIQTVKTSIPSLDQIEACVDQVEAKECRNK